jgi:hypothetical protein
MVSYTHAIIDPWAMVIVTLHANIANGTMTRSTGSYYFTVWAEIGGIELL